MSLHINKIEIKNFRSARNLSLTPARLAVLVGRNDSGKSNVLRALNLFFNDKTDISEDMDFDIDHNVFNQPNRRAKEIMVRLEISMPESYKATNGDYVVWEKRWRSEGLIRDKYVGKRRMTGSRGGTSQDTVELPAKSNVHALLRNINFIYVPAIKDTDYFSELRASIYDVIAAVANHEFRDASQEFEQSIFHQLEDLTIQITNSLGFKSRLALPNDMSHIFESLDFLSEDRNISLDSRGDGIKARHIPLILKFMADKKRGLQVQGAPPHNIIWGYEEPENNLELSSCVELADQFWEFVDDGISQMFLTTHSPVFYNLHHKQKEGEKRISCHHIYRDADEDGTKEAEELGDLDERMGTTALFAPMVAGLEDKIRQQERARAEVEELATNKRRNLFVEGPSDKVIIAKALRVFAPERVGDINVKTKQEGGGVNYVVAMLQSWRSHAKYYPELPKVAGLLDQDDSAVQKAKSWNKEPNNTESAKCFLLPKPPHILPIFHAGFRIPVVLETLYDRAAWEWADDRGHLRERQLSDFISTELNNRIINGETALDDHLNDDWSIFVKKEFYQAGKGPMARHFAQKSDDEFRDRLPCLEQLINDIMRYLFPEEVMPVEQGGADEPARQAHGLAQT